MEKVAVFDIDGTLANIDHRLHYIKEKPKNWGKFMKAIPDDTPQWPVVAILHSLKETGNTILLASGRSEIEREMTETWLRDKCSISVGSLQLDMAYVTKLYMRKANDYRGDDIVKFEILQQMRADGYEPSIVFDDRPRVVKMWRENGIFVADVNQSGKDF